MDRTGVCALVPGMPLHTHTQMNTHRTLSEVYLVRVRLMPLPGCVNASLHYGNKTIISSHYSKTRDSIQNTHTHTNTH